MGRTQVKTKGEGPGKEKGKAKGKGRGIMKGWFQSTPCLVVMLAAYSLPSQGFPAKIKTGTRQGLDLVIQRISFGRAWASEGSNTS
jgi:hypothetical protein